MRLFPTLSFSLLFFFSAITVHAQYQGQVYKYDTSIQIIDDHGKEKPLAWCGGFNNPQFTMGDLNNDGKEDLVVYERNIGVRTFINNGTAGNPNYVYAPEYELNFPPIEVYLILADYNCDGIPDLFHAGGTGFDVSTGYYNSANQLCFRHYKELFYNNLVGAVGSYNAYVANTDIPAIVDVDNDGDLDFLSFNDLGGNNAWWYKNVQKEDTLPCDSIRIILKDQCWGKFYQPATLTHLLGFSCDNSGLIIHPWEEKKTHSGNTFVLIDMDGDSDKDYLDGSVGFNNIVYLQNGRVGSGKNVDSMISQDTAWDSHVRSIYMPQWPALFNVDIDQDGLKDLLIAPNKDGEDYKCIIYMKNTGTASVPAFRYQSDTFLIDKTIDIGKASFPVFYDYDKDGKPDLFIGSDGYYRRDGIYSGTYTSRISYYKNTSTAGHPSFTLQSSNFMNLDTFNFQGSSIAIGDIDNDGKDDLILGHVPNGSSFTYFKNIAASNSVQPVWQLQQLTLKDAANNTINVGGNAAPCIYDLDHDGKPDLISGSYGGYLYYYQNTSTTPGTISLKYISKTLGKVKVDGPYYGENHSTPFIGRMDNSAQDYLLVGSMSGELYRYTGFQGDTVGPYTLLDTNYSYIDSTYLSLYRRGDYKGFRSAPAVADVDGDGKFEMVVGDIWGGLKLYKQDALVTDTPTVTTVVNKIPAGNPEIFAFPNPANNVINLMWNSAFASREISISIVTVTGQKVLEKSIDASNGRTQLPAGSLAPGMYYCILRSEKNIKTIPISIIR